MPWDGVDYHLNLLQPFQTLYDSLLQTPATDGVGGTGVEVPSLEGVMHTFENLEAGYIIDFDPYTAGSPACPAACDIPSQFQIPSLVADIAKMDPTNTTLAEWVAQVRHQPGVGQRADTGRDQRIHGAAADRDLQPRRAELTDVDKGLASINPELPALYTNAGYFTDPAYQAYTRHRAARPGVRRLQPDAGVQRPTDPGHQPSGTTAS